jgi:hypothetical protein
MSSERRQRTEFVGVRLTPAEYTKLAQDAAQRQISIPALIREALADRTDVAARGAALVRAALAAAKAKQGGA